MKLLKAALHAHTTEDPIDKIPYSSYEFIDHAASLAFDVVAITCHKYCFLNDEVTKYALSRNIVLINGIEQNIEGKHVVILNATKETEHIFTFEDLEKYKKNYNCFVLAPHPFFPMPFCLNKKLIKHIGLFDGIEFSYFYNEKCNFNKKAVEISKKHKKPLVGTSDIHILKYFNPTYALIEAEKNIASILKALNAGKTKIVSRPLTITQLIEIQFKMVFMPLLRRRKKCYNIGTKET
ncbi:hypothetical protein HYV56_02470 [Candidatus Peregrinibacteria bacterium]|nr:hypothetical protein [Candidatus Peregrinibacteria bacterium]